MSKKHPTPESFVYAWGGIKSAIKNEPNFKFHIVAAVIAIIIGFLLQLNYLEFAILTLTICMVLMLELINTTLEALVDLVSPEVKPAARIAKDVSAAAVLIGAVGSLIIGALLFLPKIF